MRKHTHDRTWGATTHDRGGGPGPPEETDGRAMLYTVEQIGPRRELMKNGALVCYDVPLARSGWMLYGPGEVPVRPNPSSPSTYVERTRDALFDDRTLRSALGAAVTNGHPNFDLHPDGVTPDNFRDLAGGYCIAVREGRDGEEDVLVGDLIITRRSEIEAIQSGKREISLGYDADYETVRPGIGRQSRILINHIALVEKGRCGPRCAIGDQAHPSHQQQQQERSTMSSTQQAQPRRRIDAAALDAIEELVSDGRRRLTGDSADDDAIHIHLHGGAATAATADRKPGDKEPDEVGERLGKVEKMVGDLAGVVTSLGESMKSYMSGGKTKDGEAEEKEEPPADETELGADRKAKKSKDDEDVTDRKKTEDSAALATSWQELQAKAEIVVPGFRMPTFDSAAPRKITVDSMCTVRTKALELLGTTKDGAALITTITGDSAFDLDAMDCSAKAMLFNSVAAAKKSANNAGMTGDARHTPSSHVLASNVPGVRVVSIEELNAQNREFWDKQSRHYQARTH